MKDNSRALPQADRAFVPSASSPSVSPVPASIPSAELTKEEFCARFKARMLAVAGPTFDDGDSIADYADETGPTYWDDPYGTPEESADADMSYWGEE